MIKCVTESVFQGIKNINVAGSSQILLFETQQNYYMTYYRGDLFRFQKYLWKCNTCRVSTVNTIQRCRI